MSKAAYQPVNTGEQNQTEKRPPMRRPGEEWAEWFRSKIEAGIWIAAFIFTFHKSQIVKQLFTNPRVTQPFFILFLTCLGINFAVTLFILYLNYFKNIRDYETYSPQITPFAAVAGFIGFTSLIVAIFPIYGFLSLVIVPVLGFGLMMFSAFIPAKGELVTFGLFAIMAAFAAIGYYAY